MEAPLLALDSGENPLCVNLCLACLRSASKQCKYIVFKLSQIQRRKDEN